MGSTETFTAYAKKNWNAIGRDGGAFYILHDVAWVMKRLLKDGWPVRKTGRVERLADESVRTFICPLDA